MITSCLPSLVAISCCSDSASVKPELQKQLLPGHLAGVLFFRLQFSATRDGCRLTVTRGTRSLGGVCPPRGALSTLVLRVSYGPPSFANLSKPFPQNRPKGIPSNHQRHARVS